MSICITRTFPNMECDNSSAVSINILESSISHRKYQFVSLHKVKHKDLQFGSYTCFAKAYNAAKNGDIRRQ